MRNDSERFLKQAMDTGAPAMCANYASPTPTPRGMLLEHAEMLRKRAHDLETLARSLPAEMPIEAERTLANALARSLYP